VIRIAVGGLTVSLGAALVSYFNLLVTLGESARHLPEVEVPSLEREVLAWVVSRSEVEHLAADAACEEYAANEVWPGVNDEAVCRHIHLRLRAALEICRFMAQHTFPKGTTRRQALRALLLDYWRARLARGPVEAEADGSLELLVPPIERGANHLWCGATEARDDSR
jgi:hypothetical protein